MSRTSPLAVRVAASASDIKAVLLKDTGLLVELKRWVAKDATGHGQIVSDADLTDDAMFDRLETDVAVRSVATWLVQKYGYLVPKLNRLVHTIGSTVDELTRTVDNAAALFDELVELGRRVRLPFQPRRF